MRFSSLGCRISLAILGVILLLIGPVFRGTAQSQQPAYNTAFLTDEQLENYQAMTESEIRDFLTRQNSYFKSKIDDVDGVEFDPAAVIAEASRKYRINPRVLLVTLQKESSGVTRSTRPSNTTMGFLMGCISSSTAREQLTCAAERFRAYHDDLLIRGTTVSGWRVGSSKQTQDGVSVTPATRAVAGQFTYTPYAGAQWGGNRSSVGGVYLFYNFWQKFGFDQSSGSAPATASATVFLLDVSGSMAENWRGGVKLESAKRAALDVISMIEQESQFGEADHQVAIATFHTTAAVELALTDDYQRARDVIARLSPQNRTNIGDGLQVSNQILSAMPVTTPKIIILLSDGLSNEGMLSHEIIAGPVQAAAAAGTCIYTVGFGERGDLDENLLRAIAEGSGCGEYTYAEAPSELERVYIRLRHQTLGTVLAEFEGQIAQNETVTVGQVDIPADKGELYITLHWPGSELDLIVTDPRGRSVGSDYPGLSLVKYQRMIYLIISDPRPGSWKLSALGRDVPENVLTYDAIVSVRDRIGPPPGTGVPLWAVALLVMLGGGGLGLVVALRSRSRSGRDSSGIQVLSGNSTGLFVPLRGKKPLIIGRAPYCDITLSDPRVSARHAKIEQTPQGFVLSDLGSRQGTYVNGRAVQQVVLRGGERVRLGHTELAFATTSSGDMSSLGAQVPRSDSPIAYLAIVVGAHEFGNRQPVNADIVLGRYTGCPLDLSADALISQRHAWLGYKDGKWYIADMSSGNGTLVNGAAITSHWLHSGDEIQLGNTRIRFTL